MTTALLERAIEAAQRLSPREKYQLIETVARSLSQTDTLETNSAAFLRGYTLDELIAAQQPPIVTNLDALAADFWPETTPRRFGRRTRAPMTSTTTSKPSDALTVSHVDEYTSARHQHCLIYS